MNKALGLALGKLVIDASTLNLTAAAKSTLDVFGQLRGSQRAIQRRARRRATAQLSEWRRSGEVSESACLDAIEVADKALASTSEDRYADLALACGKDPWAIATAIIDENELTTQAGASLLAKHILGQTLSTLLQHPTFQAQLDRAVAWATSRMIADENRRRQSASEDANTATRMRRDRLKESIQRHSRTRIAAMEQPHGGRALEGPAAGRLSREVRPAQAWRQSIEYARRELTQDLVLQNHRSTTAGPIDRMDLRGSYEAAHLALREHAHYFRPNPEHNALADESRDALDRLRREAASPRYRTALLLTGRWGAGKSRLSAEISALVSARSPMNLVLRPLPGGGRLLIDAVLEEAAIATGQPYASIRDLQDGVREIDATILIVVDDLERFISSREELDLLTQLMLDVTEDDRIRWVFAIDGWRLDRVLSPESTGRWARLTAMLPDTPSVSHWTDLDSVDLGQLVGGALIRRELGAAPQLPASMAAMFDIPLNAWLYIDTARNTGIPASILDFDEVYWLEALESLTTTPKEMRSCHVVRRVLSELYFESAGQEIPLTAIYVASQTLDRDDIEDALDVLADARLIDISPEGLVSLTSAPLWAGRILNDTVLPSAVGPSGEIDPRNLVPAIARFKPELAEALTLHLLLQITRVATHHELTMLVELLVTDNAISDAGVWAAAHNNLELRSIVLSQLSALPTDRLPRGTAHDTFLLLRLCQLEGNALPFAEMLRVIRPSYETIGANGLQAVLQELFDRLTPMDIESHEDRRTLLATADGMQYARSAAQFARRWAEIVGERAGPERMLAETNDFARSTPELTSAEIADSRGYEYGRPDAAPFVFHLIDAVVSEVIFRLGPEYAYDLFDSYGWLDSDVWQDGMDDELRRACRIGLGRAYANDPGGVFRLLERLVRGDATEQESAVFVLRHTGPTHGRREIRVPNDLYPFVERLHSSKRLDRSIKTRWVTPMLDPGRPAA